MRTVKKHVLSYPMKFFLCCPQNANSVIKKCIRLKYTIYNVKHFYSTFTHVLNSFQPLPYLYFNYKIGLILLLLIYGAKENTRIGK